ncbi:MAG: hypothetical protein ACE15F_15885 [bacterium]
MKQTTYRKLITTLMICFFEFNGSAQPDKKLHIDMQFNNYRISGLLEQKEKKGSDIIQLKALQVYNAIQDATKTVQLPYSLIQIYQQFVTYNDLFFLQGEIAPLIEINYIISLEKGCIGDFFVSNYVIPSPFHNYIVYQTSFPRMAPPEFKCSYLMIYDFKKLDDPKPIHTTNREFPPTTVGWPLYPPEYVIAQEHSAQIQDVHINPLIWAPDEKGIIFISWTDDPCEYFLVSIDISQGVERLLIRQKKIDVLGLSKWGKMHERTKQSYDKNCLPFSVRKLEWVDEKTICLHMDPSRSLLFDKTIILSLEDMETVLE